MADNLDGHDIAFVASRSCVNALQAQVSCRVAFDSRRRADASVTAIIVIRTVMAAKRHEQRTAGDWMAWRQRGRRWIVDTVWEISDDDFTDVYLP